VAILGHVGNAKFDDPIGGHTSQGVTAPTDLSAPQLHKTRYATKKRGLTGTVRTHDGRDLPRNDIERDAPESGHSSIAGMDIPHDKLYIFDGGTLPLK
jgi:hypothetical protein